MVILGRWVEGLLIRRSQVRVLPGAPLNSRLSGKSPWGFFCFSGQPPVLLNFSLIAIGFLFHPDTDQFPDRTGIIYEQWFYAPYLGVNLGVARKGFFANAYGKGSLWAWSDAEDHHLMNNTEFDDHVKNQDYIGVGLELGYNITNRFYLMVAYDYQKFTSEKDDTDIFYGDTGERGSDHNSGGIGHVSSAVLPMLQVIKKQGDARHGRELIYPLV